MDKKIISGIKSLSLDMINEAGSGHPGICLSAAPIIYTLFAYHLNYNVNDGKWINRDRFIMSAGHGSALLYSTLFYAGYKLEFEELKTFRKIGSRLTGHPELNPEIGIEMTTGPLGQGIASSVGFAIAEEYLSNNINNEIFNHYTYVLASDGDLMEGISYEASSLAGSLKLGKLIVLYESNDISLDGSTKGIFDENVLDRFKACNWHTEHVSNAEDINSINKAIIKAKADPRPSIIEIKSVIGLGSKLAGTSEVHGKPLKNDDIKNIKESLGLKNVPFYIPQDAALYFRELIEKRTKPIYDEWLNKYNTFMSVESVLTKSLKSIEINDFKVDLTKLKINFESGYSEELRETNGKLIGLIGELSLMFVCGSADVASSTKVVMPKGKTFKINGEFGKNIRFGVREGLMSAVMNGLALNNLRPIAGAFLAFSDYMKPSIRMTSLMDLPVTYVFSHDSILIGEDGPTHQPIEELAMLRSIPNMKVFRPADVREVVGTWNHIINNNCPASIIVSKSTFPQIQSSKISAVEFGGYIIKEEKARLSGIILATGSEVHMALNIQKTLNKKGIYTRVVSVPCVELFLAQSDEYKKSILPTGVKTVVLENSNDAIWNNFIYNSKYHLGVKTFGYSGKGEEVAQKLNVDEESLVTKIEELLR